MLHALIQHIVIHPPVPLDWWWEHITNIIAK